MSDAPVHDAPEGTPVEETPVEFSVAVDLRALKGGGKTFRLAASPEECALLAKRLGVPAVQRLEGEIALAVSKTEITAAGTLRAALTRQCVASLEEMTETVEDAFEVAFVRSPPNALQLQDEVEAETEAETEDWDAPEVHEGDVFDLGEFLTQQLALAMAPFPRKPGAASLAEQFGEDKPVSPFADLARRLGDN